MVLPVLHKGKRGEVESKGGCVLRGISVDVCAVNSQSKSPQAPLSPGDSYGWRPPVALRSVMGELVVERRLYNCMCEVVICGVTASWGPLEGSA